MELVKKGGVRAEEKKPGHEHAAPRPEDKPPASAEAPAGKRKIYVCDLHPEEVSDKPGQCFKDS
jgi:hypothetical protein